jgi:hypothetical protein
MKPEQSVYNKLHKFSAKEEPMKVELAIADDLKKAYTILDKANDAIDGSHQKSIQKINTILTDSKSKIADAIDAFEIELLKWQELSTPLAQQSANFVKAAKELGMNPNDSQIYKEALSVGDDYVSYLGYYKGKLNELNSLYKSLKTSI